MHKVCCSGCSLFQFSSFVKSETIEIFKKYVSDDAVCFVQVKNRRTKLGDFRHFRDGQRAQITVNNLLSSDALTFILAHEIAHFIVFSNSKQRVLPHGQMWKSVFGKLLEDLLIKECFSADFHSEIKAFAKNPGATVSRRKKLHRMLFPESEEEKNMLNLLSIPVGAIFQIPGSKKIYKKKEKRRTRFICERTDNKRHYLIHQHLKVILFK